MFGLGVVSVPGPSVTDERVLAVSLGADVGAFDVGVGAVSVGFGILSWHFPEVRGLGLSLRVSAFDIIAGLTAIRVGIVLVS
ncbi:hypothetical protein D4765_18585 [Subtercola vilae]|uniref:Uncharacterized protein n=1 Tax=Subtercola vilae TaxID=2056433 RepID=A0A4T2B9Q4_9MICO|nr:hypothetical protein D4765_18585 [Subtercola vilae]